MVAAADASLHVSRYQH